MGSNREIAILKCVFVLRTDFPSGCGADGTRAEHANEWLSNKPAARGREETPTAGSLDATLRTARNRAINELIGAQRCGRPGEALRGDSSCGGGRRIVDGLEGPAVPIRLP